ncbi:DUF3048 domain-containing protein [Actinomycetospora cinnamomea]|uniref:DUF3048 family protein n=1 Tax=Actinomycetospora cinnamomea TaxID=663609 RepID=A0A2U1F2I7_9PSEU|nr:DUF3048 domain-containing protein [Actinomycetospora cinnamomea]PVZ06395.1 hypothetical protein C8D89_113133 [Actinomycetospora cinnamomea]
MYAVKIDNTARGRPWDGVEFADVVHVEPVEGGLTRLLAVFSSRLPASVGPVRSARETDVGILGAYGLPALVYSGAAPELVPVVTSASLISTVPHDAPGAFRRSTGRPVPENLYVDLTAVRDAVPVPEPARDVGFRFGPPPAGGEATSARTVGFPAARVGLTWSPDDAAWTIAMDGVTAVYGPDRLPVRAETVVVQRVSLRDSSVRDAAGAVSPVAVTVGEGDAEVLRDGRSHPARWSRRSATDPTRLTSPGGDELPLAAGRVWVVLAPGD